MANNGLGIAAALETHKEAAIAHRLAMIRPLAELARIFRAQRAVCGPLLGRALRENEDLQSTSIEELELYRPAPTFTGFLEANDLPVFEEVLR